MNQINEILLDLLKDENSINYPSMKEDPNFLDPVQMAHLYIHSAFLNTMMEFLDEQLWLKNKENRIIIKNNSYEGFLSPFFYHELLPVAFIKDFLIERGIQEIKEIGKRSQKIERYVLLAMMDRSDDEKKKFLIRALEEMKIKYLHEEGLQTGKEQSLGHYGPRLYRTFDNLDDIFDLNYQLDQDMVIDHKTKERLYQKTGVGVQSGYSTILLSLENIELSSGSRVIDLGSGYGRVGLTYSLLRPDIEFIGYEYVPHRVEVSNKAAVWLGLERNLKYEAQDLSLESFQIPKADAYYLYDPFTKETYDSVLKQIVAISKKQNITVITKGNGRGRLDDIAKRHSWKKPVLIDKGNLCIFRSS